LERGVSKDRLHLILALFGRGSVTQRIR
jgi:hypothetical protein